MKKTPEFQYRYFIGKYLLDDKDPRNARLVVLKWETNRSPRLFVTAARTQGTVENGEAAMDVYETGEEEFGYIGGLRHVTRGWLMGQTEIRLRLASNPIYMWKAKHRMQLYLVKCSAMDYKMKRDQENETSLADEEEDSLDGPPVCRTTRVHVSVLDSERQYPCMQGQFGSLYKEKDYMEFKAQNFHPEYLGFMFDLFVHDPHAGPDYVPRHIGISHLLPMNMNETQGKVNLPILGLNNRPIGEMLVEFLITKPFPQYEIMHMQETFQSHWKSLGRSLNVGHRGMGSSYKQVSMAKENTLESLSAALRHGADLVEFDVMLCKDKEVIIYHDFSVCLSYQSREQVKELSDGVPELFEVPLKDISLKQLQRMKLSHASSLDGQNIELYGEEADHHQSHPFPSLARTLEELDEKLGFNIEVKYPMQEETGTWEMVHYFERNEFVDCVLSVIFKHAKRRKIIFSSFDPDTCVMLQLKQNKYPVLLLSCGRTQKYTPYMDFRARDFDPGIQLAQAEAFLGVNLECDGVLRDLTVVRRIKDAGLVLFVWGEECNSKANLDLLRKHGADGLIYDRMDAYHPSVYSVSGEDNLAVRQLANHSHQEQALNGL